ncbi:MAG: response regulator [Planctomycetales bacterium]|nr:response regulator [Planctomycetales bacterium]
MTERGTVFIVDDDEAAAASVEALMASIGLTSQTYGSAEAFLEDFDGTRRGCLVLDVRLPGMSGFELQRVLADRNLRVPIVFVSGHTDRERGEEALCSGALACLSKPFNGNQLCDIVLEALAAE